MKRLPINFVLTLALSGFAAIGWADFVDGPYAAEQCTNYNRPKPKNTPLTQEDIQTCCDDMTEGDEKGTAECVKLASEIERRSASGEKGDTINAGEKSNAGVPVASTSPDAAASTEAVSAQNSDTSAASDGCSGTCGRITEIGKFQKEGKASGTGAVVGGLAGGLFGNQIGNEIEKKSKGKEMLKVVVRLDQGESLSFEIEDQGQFVNGDRVQVVDGELRRY